MRIFSKILLTGYGRYVLMGKDRTRTGDEDEAIAKPSRKVKGRSKGQYEQS